MPAINARLARGGGDTTAVLGDAVVPRRLPVPLSGVATHQTEAPLRDASRRDGETRGALPPTLLDEGPAEVTAPSPGLLPHQEMGGTVTLLRETVTADVRALEVTRAEPILTFILQLRGAVIASGEVLVPRLPPSARLHHILVVKEWHPVGLQTGEPAAAPLRVRETV